MGHGGRHFRPGRLHPASQTPPCIIDSSLHHRLLPESSLAQGRIFFSLGDEPNEVIEKLKVFFLPQSQREIGG